VLPWLRRWGTLRQHHGGGELPNSRAHRCSRHHQETQISTRKRKGRRRLGCTRIKIVGRRHATPTRGRIQRLPPPWWHQIGGERLVPRFPSVMAPAGRPTGETVAGAATVGTTARASSPPPARPPTIPTTPPPPRPPAATTPRRGGGGDDDLLPSPSPRPYNGLCGAWARQIQRTISVDGACAAGTRADGACERSSGHCHGVRRW